MTKDDKTDRKPGSEPTPKGYIRMPWGLRKIPDNCKDVTSEKIGETIAIIGAKRPAKAKE